MSDDEDDDRALLSFAPGYMKDPLAWCYYETEYPEDGSVGPFGSLAEAVAHASENEAWRIDEADLREAIKGFLSAGLSLAELFEWMADHEKRRPSLQEVGAAVKLFTPGALAHRASSAKETA